jgi:hypothetical protein
MLGILIKFSEFLDIEVRTVFIFSPIMRLIEATSSAATI